MKKILIISLSLFLVACTKNIEIKPLENTEVLPVLEEENTSIFTYQEVESLAMLADQIDNINKKTAPEETEFIRLLHSIDEKVQFGKFNMQFYIYSTASDSYEPETKASEIFAIDLNKNITKIADLKQYSLEYKNFLVYDDKQFYSLLSPFTPTESSYWGEPHDYYYYQIKDDEEKNLLQGEVMAGRFSTDHDFHIFQDEIYVLYSDGLENSDVYLKKYDGENFVTVWQNKGKKQSLFNVSYYDYGYLYTDGVKMNNKYLIFSTNNNENRYIHCYDGKKIKTLIVNSMLNYTLVGNKIIFSNYIYDEPIVYSYDMVSGKTWLIEDNTYLAYINDSASLNENDCFIFVIGNAPVVQKIPKYSMVLSDKGNYLSLYKLTIEADSCVTGIAFNANNMLLHLMIDFPPPFEIPYYNRFFLLTKNQ